MKPRSCRVGPGYSIHEGLGKGPRSPHLTSMLNTSKSSGLQDVACPLKANEMAPAPLHPPPGEANAGPSVPAWERRELLLLPGLPGALQAQYHEVVSGNRRLLKIRRKGVLTQKGRGASPQSVLDLLLLEDSVLRLPLHGPHSPCRAPRSCHGVTELALEPDGRKFKPPCPISMALGPWVIFLSFSSPTCRWGSWCPLAGLGVMEIMGVGTHFLGTW